MCSTGPFQYRWLKGSIYSSCYYHHQIGSIHLSHCYQIFPWLCAWDVCYIIFCHSLHIRSGKTGNLFFIIIVQFMMSANSRIRFALQIVFVCLYNTSSHYHHCAELSEDIELRKLPVRYILSSVWVRLIIFSQLSIIQPIKQYMGLCVFSLPTPLVVIEGIYVLCLIIIIKSEVWTITHCLGLGHETMVCAVCISIFLGNNIQYIYVGWNYSSIPKHQRCNLSVWFNGNPFTFSPVMLHAPLKRKGKRKQYLYPKGDLDPFCQAA